jgi:hypothetical protein
MYQVRDKCIQIHTEQKKQRRFRHLPSLVLQNLRHYIQKYKIRVSDVWSICRKAKGKDEAVNGLIQPIHLQKGLALMGYELSLTETQSLFSYIDINQDGFISFDEMKNVLSLTRNCQMNPPSKKPIISKKSPNNNTNCNKTFKLLSPTKLEVVEHLFTPKKLDMLSPSRPKSNLKIRKDFQQWNRYCCKTKAFVQKKLNRQYSKNDFLHLVDGCNVLVQSLKTRVFNEYEEWDLYWNDVGQKNAITIQNWMRHIFIRNEIFKKKCNKGAILLQTRWRGTRARELFAKKKALMVLQSLFRMWLACAKVNELRYRTLLAVVCIQKYARQWEAKSLYKNMINIHKLTAKAILKDHQIRKCTTVIQKQWRRYRERGKCYRFRLLANAIVLKIKMKKTPGRIFKSRDWTIEEELDRLLKEWKAWNPKKYFKKNKSKNTDLLVNIERNRIRVKNYEDEIILEFMKYLNKSEKEVELNISCKKTKQSPKQSPKHSVKQHFSHLTETQLKRLEKHDHHNNERPQPSYTMIVDERKLRTFASGTIIQYKVRWRGADSKESWLSREMLMDETIFSNHCINLLKFYEKKKLLIEEKQNLQNLDKMAIIIQKTIFRGCLARLHLYHSQKAALTIQTYFRASHGKLEKRRNKLLKLRYENLVNKEKSLNERNIIKKRGERNNLIQSSTELMRLNEDMVHHPISHSILSETSCIISQIQKDLKEEVLRTINGKTFVVTMNNSWICLKCEFENDDNEFKCELCYKKRSTVF